MSHCARPSGVFSFDRLTCLTSVWAGTGSHYICLDLVGTEHVDGHTLSRVRDTRRYSFHNFFISKTKALRKGAYVHLKPHSPPKISSLCGKPSFQNTPGWNLYMIELICRPEDALTLDHMPPTEGFSGEMMVSYIVR